MEKYLTKVYLGKPGETKGYTYVCSHPSIKETKAFGSTSLNPNNAEMCFNIQCTTYDGVEYRETSNNEEVVVKRMEETLQTIKNNTGYHSNS